MAYDNNDELYDEDLYKGNYSVERYAETIVDLDEELDATALEEELVDPDELDPPVASSSTYQQQQQQQPQSAPSNNANAGANTGYNQGGANDYNQNQNNQNNNNFQQGNFNANQGQGQGQGGQFGGQGNFGGMGDRPKPADNDAGLVIPLSFSSVKAYPYGRVVSDRAEHSCSYIYHLISPFLAPTSHLRRRYTDTILSLFSPTPCRIIYTSTSYLSSIGCTSYRTTFTSALDTNPWWYNDLDLFFWYLMIDNMQQDVHRWTQLGDDGW